MICLFSDDLTGVYYDSFLTLQLGYIMILWLFSDIMTVFRWFNRVILWYNDFSDDVSGIYYDIMTVFRRSIPWRSWSRCFCLWPPWLVETFTLCHPMHRQVSRKQSKSSALDLLLSTLTVWLTLTSTEGHDPRLTGKFWMMTCYTHTQNEVLQSSLLPKHHLSKSGWPWPQKKVTSQGQQEKFLMMTCYTHAQNEVLQSSLLPSVSA